LPSQSKKREGAREKLTRVRSKREWAVGSEESGEWAERGAGR